MTARATGVPMMALTYVLVLVLHALLPLLEIVTARV
jgi:hypothetical protein